MMFCPKSNDEKPIGYIQLYKRTTPTSKNSCCRSHKRAKLEFCTNKRLVIYIHQVSPSQIITTIQYFLIAYLAKIHQPALPTRFYRVRSALKARHENPPQQ